MKNKLLSFLKTPLIFLTFVFGIYGLAFLIATFFIADQIPNKNHFFTKEELSILSPFEEDNFIGKVFKHKIEANNNGNYAYSETNLEKLLVRNLRHYCKPIEGKLCYSSQITFNLHLFKNKKQTTLHKEFFYFYEFYKDFQDFQVFVDHDEEPTTNVNSDILKRNFETIKMSFVFKNFLFTILIKENKTIIEYMTNEFK